MVQLLEALVGVIASPEGARQSKKGLLRRYRSSQRHNYFQELNCYKLSLSAKR